MSLTSSSYRYKLALHILMDEFGVIVRDVADFLMRRGQATLPEIRRAMHQDRKEYRSSEVKNALVLLFRQNIASVTTPPVDDKNDSKGPPPLYYHVDVDAVVLRIRYPRFMAYAKEIFGEEGEVIMEELAYRGQLNMTQMKRLAVEKLMQRAEEANAAARANAEADNAEMEIEPPNRADLEARVKKKAEELITGRYIVRVVPFDLSSKREVAAARSTPGLALPSDMERKGTPGSRKRKAPPIVKEEDNAVPIEIQMMLKMSGQSANGAPPMVKQEVPDMAAPPTPPASSSS